jgi:WXG100 family type VII secretion target
MSTNVIQAEYDTLDSIAARFGQQSIMSSALHAQVERSFLTLSQEGWEGRGSAAFASEMQSEVLPALQRLNHALSEAQSVTLQVRDILQEAEEEAARLFGGEGFAGESGNGSGGAAGAADGAGSAGGGGGSLFGAIAGSVIGGAIAGPVGIVAGGIVGWSNIDTGMQIISATLSGTDSAVSYALKHIDDIPLDDAKLLKGIGKGAKVLGYVLDAYEIATGEDKGKEIAGFVGGEIGSYTLGAFFGAVGTAIGGPPGGVVGAFAGGAIGGWVGEWGAEKLYDVAAPAVAPVVEDIGGYVMGAGGAIVEGIGEGISDIGEGISDIGEGISDIGEGISNIGGVIMGGFG